MQESPGKKDSTVIRQSGSTRLIECMEDHFMCDCLLHFGYVTFCSRPETDKMLNEYCALRTLAMDLQSTKKLL